MKGKSVVQSQKYLTQVNPAAFPPPPERDQTKVVSPDKTLISFVADEECMELMERFKELYPKEKINKIQIALPRFRHLSQLQNLSPFR